MLSDIEDAARNFRIPEMVQAIFFAMVVNEALEFGVFSRDLAEHLKSALEHLRWFILKLGCSLKGTRSCGSSCYGHVDLGARPGPTGGQEESSGSSDAPPPSSDDE